ncbi:aminoglycoside phosphotransferase (APT) family kinase protein [Streptomyces africanus]|uniref:Aminoglycoside phosphotransferase (APT) family kinase protein n=1 Tax=Streptomyces africanus TaxID=231024 RepID=A0ABU0QNF5_9ACTN|nr:phosphotransferase [Streptomyces africanus]MDQ0748094.1 aminoglycoside phosphotransferase (APT) family kinase protein [Streptomyces africanus]
MPSTPLGRLLGSGRSADVYEIDEAWVLRREREGGGDAAGEGAVMAHVRAHGYPVPRVRPTGSRTDLVMERLSGPTLLQACLAGTLDPTEAGSVLARLLRDLHTLPALRSTDPAVRVLHLDLHPENVILTPDGPRVIDWSNTEEGDPALDRAVSAVILAQAAVAGDHLAGPARTMLTALLADASPLVRPALTEALRRRSADPAMSRGEVELLGEAEELILSQGRTS